MYYRIYEEVGDNVVVKRMRYYPIVLFICYFPGFIFRLQKVRDNPHVVLGIVYSFLKGIYGFFNAILFSNFSFHFNRSALYLTVARLFQIVKEFFYAPRKNKVFPLLLPTLTNMLEKFWCCVSNLTKSNFLSKFIY